MKPIIRVIINSDARTMKNEKDRNSFTKLLADMLPDASVLFTDEHTKVVALVQQAIADKPSLLIAGGGDGTINAVASATIGTDILLGILPLGTLNHFAKDLGIPEDVTEAVTLLRDGHATAVDVGEVNDRIFLNNAGLGLYPDIVHQREARQRLGARKWPAAVLATLRALARYRLLGIRIKADGNTMLRRTPAVLVGNNEYTTEHSLEPKRVSLTAGTLSLYIPRPRGRAKLLWFSLCALIGSVRESDGFEVMLAEQFTIESNHRHLRVSIDGEVTNLETPLHFAIRARALRVIAPPAIA